ncbi:MAG: spore coat protein CotJB [Oscillospiraceae bacterium]|nr:spore coat protein CotJB [Oscillospiraceae bacterium]
MNEREKAMKDVQIADFALIDTILYLDTHPTDKDALEQYDKYKKISENARWRYTSKFGPLNSNMVDPSNKFDWVNNPWPWEVDA